MKLAIYYHRLLVSTGKPICVSNGKSEIHTDKIILQNITGQVIFNSTKGRGIHLGQARRHGTTTPLEIEILPDPEVDFEVIEVPVTDKRTHALQERERYRRNHPEVKGYRLGSNE
jgi:hypothetical protein